ncbi:AAA family ATPase [Rhizobium sp. BK456]|uniref:AAA family ATPase n=1 Tax=Rhizobium sp. BK456 TaxID=2587007 RepID=UPI00161C1C9E|nr:AAA family ATPase [Rhizobium sp. BK456]MBB3524699.1 putative ATPase [Rhizobium sp. BK456]
MNRLVLISGCSGGGKSTLLAELGRRGHAIVEEPGRRIVKQELEGDGAALPWIDIAAFARRAIEMAAADHAAARGQAGWTFFDRGLIDAASALQHLTGEPILEKLSAFHRHNTRVFITPPWPEIYLTDPERRHGFDEAVAEYSRLAAIYPTLGYDVVTLPKIAVAERADFILDRFEAK